MCNVAGLQVRRNSRGRGDRNPDAHVANLYHVDAKYGDVVRVQEVLNQLQAHGAI